MELVVEVSLPLSPPCRLTPVYSTITLSPHTLVA